MQELIKKIEDWGKRREIDHCDPLLQTTKIHEEIIELQRAIIKAENNTTKYLSDCDPVNDYIPPEYLTDIKDAIGDIFVTIVMLSMQSNRNFDDLLRYKSYAHNLIGSSFDLTTHMLYYISEFQRLHYTNIDIDDIPTMLTRLLFEVADRYNLTLEECVQHSYNEIKDRKGKIVDGLFVKEVK